MLTDQQIADVLTFVRNSWNNQAPAVSAEAVAKVRRATRAP
jgi:mono/diheme cytochrome c family protein